MGHRINYKVRKRMREREKDKALAHEDASGEGESETTEYLTHWLQILLSHGRSHCVCCVYVCLHVCVCVCVHACAHISLQDSVCQKNTHTAQPNTVMQISYANRYYIYFIYIF